MRFKVVLFISILLQLWNAIASEAEKQKSNFYETSYIGHGGLDSTFIVEPWPKVALTHILTDEGKVSPECMAYLNQFSIATSKFINCTVLNARPLHYCEKCVSEYLSVTKVYDIIFEDDGVGTTNCKEEILRADNIQVVLMAYNFVMEVWKKSTCDNCFAINKINGTTIYKPTNATQRMLNLIHVTLNCIHNHADMNSYVNSSVCISCSKAYCDANDFYGVIKKNGKLCSDLVDSMNYTRMDWSGKYNCTVSRKDEGEIWGIAAVVCALPLILYLGVWFHAIRPHP